MTDFTSSRISRERDLVATDGSDVRTLQTLSGGAMAQFFLAAGQTSTAVTHRTIEERGARRDDAAVAGRRRGGDRARTVAADLTTRRSV